MPFPRLPVCCTRGWFWLSMFLLWGITLWILSDGPVPIRKGPTFPGLDKLLHFGYFFGGAGLLSTALYLHGRPRSALSLSRLVLTVVIVLAAIGALDEWHQSWVPKRSGNDLGDWLADVAGALTGTLLFTRLRLLLDRAVQNSIATEDPP